MKHRSAFTLIELLVVIAIIAVLIGLLLPAVQKVREAAARMKCQNHLKQLGLGAHNYHNANAGFPRGFSNQTHTRAWSWAVVILPYMEQQGLHTSLNPDLAAGGMGTATGNFIVPVVGFICPSDPATGTNADFGGYSRCSYPASRHVFTNVGEWPQCRIGRITDGTSNTLMIGERESVRNLSGLLLGKNVTTASVQGMAYWKLNVPYSGTSRGAAINLGQDPECTRYNWTSNHPGGVNFVLCDGSVRFVSDTISSQANGNGFCATAAVSEGGTIYRNFPLQNLYHVDDGNVAVE